MKIVSQFSTLRAAEKSQKMSDFGRKNSKGNCISSKGKSSRFFLSTRKINRFCRVANLIQSLSTLWFPPDYIENWINKQNSANWNMVIRQICDINRLDLRTRVIYIFHSHHARWLTEKNKIFIYMTNERERLECYRAWAFVNKTKVHNNRFIFRLSFFRLKKIKFLLFGRNFITC